MVDEINEDLEQMGDEIGDLMSQDDDALGGEESTAEAGAATVAEGEYEGMPGAEDDDDDINVDLIMDLPLQVVVELGRTKMLINDLLQIGQGSVIELNKQVGEALDVLVNGKLVARGEVVVVKDKFGVRITEVLSTIERIKQLN